MDIARSMATKAESAKGSIKKTFGRATRNRHLQLEGRIDQAKAHTKLASGNLKDGFLSPARKSF